MCVPALRLAVNKERLEAQQRRMEGELAARCRVVPTLFELSSRPGCGGVDAPGIAPQALPKAGFPSRSGRCVARGPREAREGTTHSRKAATRVGTGRHVTTTHRATTPAVATKPSSCDVTAFV